MKGIRLLRCWVTHIRDISQLRFSINMWETTTKMSLGVGSIFHRLILCVPVLVKICSCPCKNLSLFGFIKNWNAELFESQCTIIITEHIDYYKGAVYVLLGFLKLCFIINKCRQHYFKYFPEWVLEGDRPMKIGSPFWCNDHMTHQKHDLFYKDILNTSRAPESPGRLFKYRALGSTP